MKLSDPHVPAFGVYDTVWPALMTRVPPEPETDVTVNGSPSMSMSLASTGMTVVWPSVALAESLAATGGCCGGGIGVLYVATTVWAPAETFRKLVVRAVMTARVVAAAPPSTVTPVRPKPPNAPGRATLCASLEAGTVMAKDSCLDPADHDSPVMVVAARAVVKLSRRSAGHMGTPWLWA